MPDDRPIEAVLSAVVAIHEEIAALRKDVAALHEHQAVTNCRDCQPVNEEAVSLAPVKAATEPTAVTPAKRKQSAMAFEIAHVAAQRQKRWNPLDTPLTRRRQGEPAGPPLRMAVSARPRTRAISVSDDES